MRKISEHTELPHVTKKDSPDEDPEKEGVYDINIFRVFSKRQHSYVGTNNLRRTEH